MYIMYTVKYYIKLKLQSSLVASFSSGTSHSLCRSLLVKGSQ